MKRHHSESALSTCISFGPSKVGHRDPTDPIGICTTDGGLGLREVNGLALDHTAY